MAKMPLNPMYVTMGHASGAAAHGKDRAGTAVSWEVWITNLPYLILDRDMDISLSFIFYAFLTNLIFVVTQVGGLWIYFQFGDYSILKMKQI